MTDLRKELEDRLDRLATEQQTLDATLKTLDAIAPHDPEAMSLVMPLGTTLGEAKRRLIVATLAWKKFNKTATADALGISRRSIYNLLEELGAPSQCEHCQAEFVAGGEPWPLPNLCPPCDDYLRAKREEAARKEKRRMSDAGARAVLRRGLAGESFNALADEYNVHPHVIRNIVWGRTYRHIHNTAPETTAETTAEHAEAPVAEVAA